MLLLTKLVGLSNLYADGRWIRPHCLRFVICHRFNHRSGSSHLQRFLQLLTLMLIIEVYLTARCCSHLFLLLFVHISHSISLTSRTQRLPCALRNRMHTSQIAFALCRWIFRARKDQLVAQLTFDSSIVLFIGRGLAWKVLAAAQALINAWVILTRLIS